MSSILSEDVIKSSCKMEGQSINNECEPTFSLTEVELIVNEAIKTYHDTKVRSLIKDCAMSINKLEEQIAELNTKLENFNEEYNESSDQNNLGVTESRSIIVYPILRKKGRMSSADVKNVCKIKHSSAVYRVMDKVVEMYPDECFKDKGLTGQSKNWLVHKDYLKGF